MTILDPKVATQSGV